MPDFNVTDELGQPLQAPCIFSLTIPVSLKIKYAYISSYWDRQRTKYMLCSNILENLKWHNSTYAAKEKELNQTCHVCPSPHTNHHIIYNNNMAMNNNV